MQLDWVLDNINEISFHSHVILDHMIFQGPFQPGLFYDFMTVIYEIKKFYRYFSFMLPILPHTHPYQEYKHPKSMLVYAGLIYAAVPNFLWQV